MGDGHVSPISSIRHQHPMPQQQKRGIFSSFSSSNVPFDPLQQTSATVLKQPMEELSELEQKLQEVLKDYAEYMETTEFDLEDEDLLAQDVGYEEKMDALQAVYMDLGYWSDALGIEQTKCHLYYEADTEEYADSIHAQGKLYLRQQDFNNSKALYDQALEYFESTGNSVQVGHVLISLAGWYYFQDQLDRAMEHLCKAEPLLDSNPPLLVKCLDNQGLVHRLWGDYHAALDKYQQALVVVDPVKEEETRHALLMHLGDMYQAIEEPQEALQVYLDLVQEMEKKTADIGSDTASVQAMKGQQGVLWHNIATIHVDFGDYELALDEFDRAIQLKTEMGGANHPEVAKTWNSLGVLHAGALRQLPKARECFQHALMIARINADDPSTDEDVIRILQNISHIEQQLNR